MVGALIVAVVAGLAAIVFVSKSKSESGDLKPRSIPLAAVSAFVGSVAILVAFPQMLSIAQEATGPWWAKALIVAVGVILILLAVSESDKIPTWVLLVGMLVVTWGVFRWIPTAPVAFEHLGENLGKIGDLMGETIKTLIEDLTP